MDIQATELIVHAGSWSPELIVSLVKEVAWPLVILILGFCFRSSLIKGFSNFFTKNQVEELTAGTAGITAKFRETQQNAEKLDNSASKVAELPEGADYEAINQKHEAATTAFSTELYELVKNHLEALDIDDKQKIDLLTKEASIQKAALMYFDVSKVLFRSQFDLFNYRMNDNKSLTHDEVHEYFEILIEGKPDGYEGWDAYRYMAYPVSSGLVEVIDDNYVLTTFGESFVQFLLKQPSLVDELTKL